MTLPPPELTDAQLAALARGREIRHSMRGPMLNGQVAARVFRDAIAAIEENGSATAYFRLVAEREPVAFMKFLGQVLGKYLPHESSTDVEAEKVYRSPEELRQALRERGISPALMHILADRMAASQTPDADAAHPPQSSDPK